jgi:Ca-activated chloride channel family protein
MMDSAPSVAFHFLRPDWLWALLPLAAITIALARQGSAAARWRGVIAPHLLEHLIVQPKNRRRIRPLHLLAVAGLLATIAMAGPSWRREPPPFTQDTAPLVIALELTDTMLVGDVQPSRLERSKQKIRDLLAERASAPTGLLVYAGTAHLVMPFTDDPSVIEAYVADLQPDLMPVAGDDAAAALAVAERMLADESTPGTILFVTDGFSPANLPAFGEHRELSRDQLVALAVATEAGGLVPGTSEIAALDRSTLDAFQRDAGVSTVTVTVDDSDVQQVTRRIANHLAAVQQEDERGRWRDEGWWLVFPVAAITLVWFRRGWMVQWEG